MIGSKSLKKTHIFELFGGKGRTREGHGTDRSSVGRSAASAILEGRPDFVGGSDEDQEREEMAWASGLTTKGTTRSAAQSKAFSVKSW